MQQKPRIKTLDIETAPLESYTWGIWEQDVGIDQIKTEWSVISYAIKDLGDPKVRYRDTGGRGPKKVRDDKALLVELHKELDDCDILIAQNGRAFDTKKVNARMAMHGIRPYSPVRVIDTLLMAKKHFMFTSNKLDWLSRNLTDHPKDTHKEFPGFELWIECMKDNPKAWEVLKRYNIQDVVAAEKVYLRFRPWIVSHPSLAVYAGGDQHLCPACGSSHVQRRGEEVTQAAIYARYHCQECGKWSRGKVMENTPRERKALLVG